MPEEEVAKPAESGAEDSGPEEETESKSIPESSEKSDDEVTSGAGDKPAQDVSTPKQGGENSAELKRLSRSIGMAMPSNRFRVFLGQGAIPPVTEKKHFVARLKNLDRIEVVILEGDHDQADKNEFVGEVGLANVKIREDGRAEIEVDFMLGDKGMLSVILSDRIGGAEGIGRFILPQFRGEIGDGSDITGLPVEELSKKIDLLEQQMQLLEEELKVRREREKS